MPKRFTWDVQQYPINPFHVERAKSCTDIECRSIFNWLAVPSSSFRKVFPDYHTATEAL